MDNSVLSQSDAEPHRAERVVYRHGQKGWLNLVWSVPFCLFCFWLATSQFFLDKSAPTAEEIAKGQVTDNSILLWVNFGFGALLLLFAFSLVWSQLFFRLVADRDGVCWRPFIEWKSALWSEVTECHLSITNTPEIRAKEELITLQSSAPGWPATRDYIAARVQLPDGIEAWQPKPVADSEEKRARLSKDDDGTPIKTSTKIGWFALMGVVIMGGFTLALLNEGKGVGGGDIFLLAIVGALFVALPLLLQVRDFVICDDLSLTIGTLKQRRTVAFADIEDLFLLRHRNQHSVTWKPCIVVAGETIPLENLGKKRDAMLNRIEARALNSRSPQFARRDFAPLADKLALPARFNYRDALAKIKWRCAQLTLLALLCPALVGVAIYNVGWENLEDSRGILAFSGVALALVLSWAGKRALAKLCRARARFNLGEELRADESGFWFESRAATTNIAWPDIARLESDTPNGWDATCRVYDVRGDFIEFDEQIARADLLGLLLLERSGLKWQSSPQTLALLHGITRDERGLIVREKSSISRLWAQMWLGMWSLIPLLSFCGTLFDSEGDWAAYFQGLWFMLLPPIGIVLFLGLAIWVSMWRTVTICHERGLSHRGWFAPRFVDWDDIEEVGSAIFWDWVRAHDGRTIRMTFPARPEVGKAREELRAEIMRRAPGAKGGWKAKD